MAEQTEQMEGQTQEQTGDADEGQEKQDVEQVEAEPSEVQEETTQSPQPESKQTAEQGEAEGQALSEGQVSSNRTSTDKKKKLKKNAHKHQRFESSFDQTDQL